MVVNMGLPKEVFRMLENIVEPEYVSDHEYVLAAYRRPLPNMPRKPVSPDAVVLPGSVEEVQAIVRLCNKYKIRYIPTVSGAWFETFPAQTGTIIINLKRMNRILEINEEDRYAVIEPGVRHGQLKTELVKRGLSYPVVCVGPGCSVLTSFACFSGDHMMQWSTSRTNRYVLGAEWVLPTGEILKVGSLGCGAGWFCPDGPGPSLRGLLKGYVGWGGGLGVVTKVAIGLDAWKGVKEIPVEGRSPSYKVRIQDCVPAPGCFKVFIFKFPSFDDIRDAIIEIGKAEIGFAVLKFFNATAGLLITESANDFWELWKSGLLQKEMANALWIYLVTWSPEEMAYEEKVLMDIIKEKGGEPIDESLRLKWQENVDFFFLMSFVQRTLRLSGGWMPLMLSADSVSHMFEAAKSIPEFLGDFIAKGLILNAPDNFQIIPMEYGHLAHIELIIFYDRNLPEAYKIPLNVMEKSIETQINHGYHTHMPPRALSGIIKLGPLYSNYHVWAIKIKDAFDPYHISNPA
jgi:glycolate oxidase